MTDDRRVRPFLQRMANEIDASPVDPRDPVRRARRHRSVMTGVVVVIVAAVVATGSIGVRSFTETRPAEPPTIPTPVGLTSAIDARIFGSGDPAGYTVQAPAGWFTDGRNVVKRGSGVLAVTVWDVEKVPRDPCHWQGTIDVPGPTVDDLVTALATQRMRNATTPTDVTLGGYSGRYLEWSVPADMVVTGDADFHGCDSSGNGHLDFVGWFSNLDAEQYAQVAGQVDRLWVLDVDGQRVLVDATYSPDTTQTERSELDRVVQSLRFSRTAPIGPNGSLASDLPPLVDTKRVGTVRAFGTTWNVKVSRAKTAYYAAACVEPATTGSTPNPCERGFKDRVSVQSFDQPSPSVFVSQFVGDNVGAVDVVADDGRVFHAVMVRVRSGGSVAVVALEGGGSGRFVYHLKDGGTDRGRGPEAHVEWTDVGQVIGAGSFPPPGRA